jgi:Flp pilus assembly protein TadG
MLLCVALVALLALVVDGGRTLSAREAALTEAEQAARLGAAQLSATSLHEGETAFEVTGAIAAAEQFMTASGHPGTAVVLGTQVVATVRTYKLATPLLSFVGFSSMPVSASASATAVVG